MRKENGSFLLVLSILVGLAIVSLSGFGIYYLVDSSKSPDKEVQTSFSDENNESNVTLQNKDVQSSQNILEENAIEKPSNLSNYIGYWSDDGDYNSVEIHEINDSRIVFDLGIFRITILENLIGKFEMHSDKKVASFTTDDLEGDDLDFWRGVYGTIALEEDKVIVEITSSTCEYIDTGIFTFNNFKK